MVNFICSLLGLSFNGLSEPLQITVVICASALVLFFCDTIVRLVISPLFRLLGGNK